MSTATITRSASTATAGDAGAGTCTFELDKDTGIVTMGGQDEQMWVLVWQSSDKKDLAVCGGIYESTDDGGELVCLRKCMSQHEGIEAVHKHDGHKDIIQTCSRHRSEGAERSFCIPGIWKLANSFRRTWTTLTAMSPDKVDTDLQERQGRWRLKQRRRDRVSLRMTSLYCDPYPQELLLASIHLGSGQHQDWSADPEQEPDQLLLPQE